MVYPPFFVCRCFERCRGRCSCTGTIDGVCRERIYPFQNARRAFLLAVIFRKALSFPPGAYSFCLSGLALSLAAALCLRQGKCLPSHFSRLTPPLAALPHGPKRVGRKTTHRGGAKTLLPQRHAPSPMYPSRTARLQLRYWVALPAQGNSAGATVAEHLAQL